MQSIRHRRARTVGAVLTLALLATGCMPAPMTLEGERVRWLYDIFLIIAAIVFVAVSALIGWSVIRYRAAPDDPRQPARFSGSVLLELVWWGIPTVLVIALFVLTVQVLGDVHERADARAEAGDALDVSVEAFMWQWRFAYDEAGVEVVGLPGEPPRVVLPVDRPIRFTFTSPDVIHSFFVPAFAVKWDVVPGRENHLSVTITEEGTYTGLCAEFCGLLHADMLFTVEAVSDDAFRDWLAEQGGEAP